MQPVDYAAVESRLSGSDNLSSKMHPFPCSALLTCFGNTPENTPFEQPNAAPVSMEEEEKTEAAPAVCLQPSTAAASSTERRGERDSEEMFKGSRRSEKQSTSSNHTAAQAVPATTQPSVFAAKELSQEVIALCTHIPRPSIIHVPKVSALEVTVQQGKRTGLLLLSREREGGKKNPWEHLPCIDWHAVRKGLMAVLTKIVQYHSYSFPALLSEALGDVCNNSRHFYSMF